MKHLTREQVFDLKLNIHSNIWTTGFIELDLEETYKTPFGVLKCKPGTGWHFEGIFNSKQKPIKGIYSYRHQYLLEDFLKDKKIKYAFDCQLIRKLHKKKTSGLVFKILGYPHNIKCWI